MKDIAILARDARVLALKQRISGRRALHRDTSFSENVAKKGLFVVGHARSGTTILLDALNSCDSIYCFGEANFYKNADRPDFSNWYNAKHRSFANPWMRSTYAPEIPNATGWEILEHLSRHYKYVGGKLAFRQEGDDHDYAAFFSYSMRYFPTSTYICVLREPLKVTASDLRMFNADNVNDDTIRATAISQLQTYYLILALYFSIPNVLVLIHERIGKNTFNQIGKILDIDLSQAYEYYDFSKNSSKPNAEDVLNANSAIKLAIHYYQGFVSAFDRKTLRAKNALAVRSLLFDLYKDLELLGFIPTNQQLIDIG